MNKPTKNKTNRPIYKRWYFWAIIGAIAIIALFSGNGDTAENNDTPKEEVEKTSRIEPSQENSGENQEAGIDNTAIDEGDVEYACQDAKYYMNSSFYRNNVKNLINVFNYNKYFIKVATTKDGEKPVIQFTWNGTDKNGEIISFVCYAFKNDTGEIVPIQIKANNNDIWKTDADFMAIVKE